MRAFYILDAVLGFLYQLTYFSLIKQLINSIKPLQWEGMLSSLCRCKYWETKKLSKCLTSGINN